MSTAPIQRKRANRPGGSVDPSRTAAIGGTRVARIAGRRLAISVTRIPARSATTAVRVSKTSPVFGSVKPTSVEEAEETSRKKQAEEEPDDGGDDADDERLDEDRSENLAAGRSERPERRELARPLRDRDREGVRDDERADEERDAAEGEEEPSQEGDELVRAFGVVVGDLLPGPDLRVRREDLVDLRSSSCCVVFGLRRDGDLVQPPFLPEQALRRRQVEAGERRAADREPGRELHDPRELEPLHRALRLDADDLADLEVLLGRGLLVHDRPDSARATSPRRASAG